jgi:hypothetical protein
MPTEEASTGVIGPIAVIAALLSALTIFLVLAKLTLVSPAPQRGHHSAGREFHHSAPVTQALSGVGSIAGLPTSRLAADATRSRLLFQRQPAQVM